jgi:diacylglycerol kinase
MDRCAGVKSGGTALEELRHSTGGVASLTRLEQQFKQHCVGVDAVCLSGRPLPEFSLDMLGA